MVDPNLHSKLEALGLQNVKLELSMGKPSRNGNPEHYNAVVSWVELQEKALASEAAARAEAREAAMLEAASQANELASKANDIAEKARSEARFANKLAITAMILSAATAIIVAVIQFINQTPSP